MKNKNKIEKKMKKVKSTTFNSNSIRKLLIWIGIGKRAKEKKKD